MGLLGRVVYFGDRDGLLFYGFVDGYTVVFSYFYGGEKRLLDLGVGDGSSIVFRFYFTLGRR